MTRWPGPPEPSSGGSGGLLLAKAGFLGPTDSDQAFEQSLELADLDLDLEGAVERVEDRDGEGSVVAVALEEVDDPAVLDLALADA